MEISGMDDGTTELIPHFLVAIAFLVIFSIKADLRQHTFGKAVISGLALLSFVLALLHSLIPLSGIPIALLLAGSGILVNNSKPIISISARIALGLLTFALSIHVFGWQKVILNPEMDLGATPFQWYVNFDKPFAGLAIALSFFVFSQPIPGSSPSYKRWFAVITLGLAGLILMTLQLGANLNPKWTEAVTLFLLTNLFFTVIPEELFFRTLIQSALPTRSFWQSAIAVGIMTLLFTVAHVSPTAEPAYLVLVGFAAFLYAISYHLTRSVLCAITAHFVVNLLSVSVFDYPVQVNL